MSPLPSYPTASGSRADSSSTVCRFVFLQSVPIDDVQVTEDNEYIVLVSITAGQIILLPLLTPTVYYVISSSYINMSVSPCYVKAIDSFLFAGTNSGELLVVNCVNLYPPMKTVPFCHEDHRIRLDCDVLSGIYCPDAFHLILCDQSSRVIQLSLF